MKRPIYMDNSATTRCDPRVVEAMVPYLADNFNASSETIHLVGRRRRRSKRLESKSPP